MRSQVAIRPAAGLLVLFPSWLRHSVRPHHGDRERVSVAINLSLAGALPEFQGNEQSAGLNIKNS
jgi:hypothetical protein